MGVDSRGHWQSTDDTTEKVKTTEGVALKVDHLMFSKMNTAPVTATDAGELGDIRITATHIYVCVATDTWVRADLATW